MSARLACIGFCLVFAVPLAPAGDRKSVPANTAWPERIDQIWRRALTLASLARRSPPQVFSEMLRAEWEAERRPSRTKVTGAGTPDR